MAKESVTSLGITARLYSLTENKWLKTGLEVIPAGVVGTMMTVPPDGVPVAFCSGSIATLALERRFNPFPALGAATFQILLRSALYTLPTLYHQVLNLPHTFPTFII